MTDELALKYAELKEKETEEKEKKKAQQKKPGKTVKTSIVIVIGLFFLIAILSDLATRQKKLERGYTQFFEKPCIRSRALARERGKDWSNQVKETIIGQAEKNFTLRKAIYEVHRRDCSRLINSGTVLSMAEVKTKLVQWHSQNRPSQKQSEKISIKRRTSTGVPIERGADIDYRIDSDKLINLSVSRIRSEGYRCGSLSSIDLYNYNKSIVVRCNESKDKYRIYPASGWVTRE